MFLNYVSIREYAGECQGAVAPGTGWSILEPSELCHGRIPDLDGLDIVANDVLQMRREGGPVDFRAGPLRPNPLGDVEDYRRVPILVHPDLLVIGDLANLAKVTRGQQWRGSINGQDSNPT